MTYIETPVFPMSTPPVRDGVYKIKYFSSIYRYSFYWHGKWYCADWTVAGAQRMKNQGTISKDCYIPTHVQGWIGIIGEYYEAELTKEQEFLKELTLLTKKHNLVISGCGCCGSPSVDPLGEDEQDGEYEINKILEWTTNEII